MYMYVSGTCVLNHSSQTSQVNFKQTNSKICTPKINPNGCISETMQYSMLGVLVKLKTLQGLYY